MVTTIFILYNASPIEYVSALLECGTKGGGGGGNGDVGLSGPAFATKRGTARGAGYVMVESMDKLALWPSPDPVLDSRLERRWVWDVSRV